MGRRRVEGSRRKSRLQSGEIELGVRNRRDALGLQPHSRVLLLDGNGQFLADLNFVGVGSLVFVGFEDFHVVGGTAKSSPAILESVSPALTVYFLAGD